MAPEQARGEVREVGRRWPMFMPWAVILYECSRDAHRSSARRLLDTLQQVRNHEQVPPSRLQPKIRATWKRSA